MLTGNANPLIGTLNQTSRAINGLASEIDSALGKVAGRITGVLGKLLTGNFSGAILGAFSGIKDTVWDFVGSIKDGIKSIAMEGIQARQLGIDISDLRAAMRWAGPAADGMAIALGHLSMKFAEASLGSASARRDFESLAKLSGTNAGALQSGGMLPLIDAIASIPDATQRAAQAFRFFKSSAGEVLDQLRQGGAAKARDWVKRMGLEVSEQDLANIRQTAIVINQLSGIGAGIFNQVLLGISPIVNEVNKLFAGVKIDLSFIKPLVINIAEQIALFGVFLGTAATDSKVLSAAFDVVWKQAQRGFLNFKALVLDGLADIADVMVKTFKLNVPKLGIAEKAILEGLGFNLKDGASAGAREAAVKARTEAKALGEAAADGWGGVWSGVLNSPWGKFVSDLFGRARAGGGAALPGAGANVPEIAMLNDKFNTLAQSLTTPADAFNESATQLNRMLELGVGSPGMIARGAFTSGQTLLGAAGMSSAPAFAGAAELQSREAYSALARFEAEGMRGGIQERIAAALDVIKRMEELQESNGREVLMAVNRVARNTDLISDATASTEGGAW